MQTNRMIATMSMKAKRVWWATKKKTNTSKNTHTNRQRRRQPKGTENGKRGIEKRKKSRFAMLKRYLLNRIWRY